MCMCMHVYAHTHGGQRRELGIPSVTLHVTPLRQGLVLNLELVSQIGQQEPKTDCLHIGAPMNWELWMVWGQFTALQA